MVPPSAAALDALLQTDTPKARAIRAAFDRARLSRWRRGVRAPGLDAAIRLHAICRRIRPDGWTVGGNRAA